MMRFRYNRIALLLSLNLALVGLARCIDFATTTLNPDDYDDYIDNSIDLERTYVSHIEKVLKTLAIPLKVVDEAAQTVQNGLMMLINKLPNFLKNCLTFTQNRALRGFGDVLNHFEDKFHAVYPGTVWCGAGNVARYDEELGFFDRTDSCCREHDKCTLSIPAQAQKSGLLNNGLFTRSHCSCDEKFYKCLKDAKNLIAIKIGITYFNILRPQCFKETYPITSCREYDSLRLIDKKCNDYVLDYNGRPRQQWFDNPDF